MPQLKMSPNYKLAELASEFDRIDVNQLTPVEALNTIVKMKEKLRFKNTIFAFCE